MVRVNGEPLRVAIIDDHLMFAEGLRAWLGDNAPTVRVTYLGGDPAEALARAGELDVVLLDIDLGPGGPRAADTVEAFGTRGIPVLLVSAVVRGTALREALLAGAGGCTSVKGFRRRSGSSIAGAGGPCSPGARPGAGRTRKPRPRRTAGSMSALMAKRDARPAGIVAGPRLAR